MKNIKKIFAAALALLMLSSSVIAADVNVQKFNVSTLKLTDSASKSGFSIQGTSGNQKFIAPELVSVSDSGYSGTAIKMAATADENCRVFAYVTTKNQTLTVIDMMMKPDVYGDEALTIMCKNVTVFYRLLKIDSSGMYAFFTGSNPASGDKATGVTVSNRWYHIQFAFRNEPNNKALELYVDGKLVVKNTSSALTALIDELATTNNAGAPNRLFRLDIGVGKKSTWYLGDSSIYSPGLVQVTSATERITKNTDPVKLEFSRPIKAIVGDLPGVDNFLVKDKDGNTIENAVATVEPVVNSEGFATSANLTFSQTALVMDETYWVETTGCYDVFGKYVATSDELDITGANTFIYAPYPFTLAVDSDDREVDYLDETVTVSFSESIKTKDGSDFGADNIKVTDQSNQPVELASVNTTENADGRITSVDLAFAEGAVNYNSTYKIEVVNCVGEFNQGFESPGDGSDSFTILPAPYDYKWDEVKVFKYTGLNKNEISTLTAGMISVEAQYSNSGRLSKNVTLIAEVYRGSELAYRMETANRALGSNGDSLKSDIGLYLSSASDITVNIKLVDADGNTLLEKKGADLFEN